MFSNLSMRTNYDMAILVDDMRSRRIAYNFENLKQVQTELINRRMESKYIGDIADMMRSMLESGVMESPPCSDSTGKAVNSYHISKVRKIDSNVKSVLGNLSSGSFSDNSEEISAIKRRMARKAEIIRQLKELDSEEDDDFSDDDISYGDQLKIGADIIDGAVSKSKFGNKHYENGNVQASDSVDSYGRNGLHSNLKSGFSKNNSGKQYKGKKDSEVYKNRSFDSYGEADEHSDSLLEGSFFKDFESFKKLKNSMDMEKSIGSRSKNISIPEARKQELGFEYFNSQEDTGDVELDYPVFQFLQVFYKIFAWFFAIATMLVYTVFAVTTKLSVFMLVGLFGASIIASVSIILLFYALSENILWKLDVLRILKRKN